MLRNDVEDAVLKGMLSKVEIGFKEDEFLYLICAYPALTDMIQRGHGQDCGSSGEGNRQKL